jgi:hypothetical protein
MRITAACPEAMVFDGNQLAMCLAYGPADGETYRLPCGWQDADGNLYSAASWEASAEWIAAAQALLTRPAWDVDEIIDMEAAERAQAALVFSLEPVAASPSSLTAIAGVSGPDALNVMGLVPVQSALDSE